MLRSIQLRSSSTSVALVTGGCGAAYSSAVRICSLKCLQAGINIFGGRFSSERLQLDRRVINEGCAQDGFSPRLGQMLTDLKELLETLVPDKDHVSIAENLDVAFLMQQVENGVLDISRLAKWLSSLLKSHCAPVRDAWADSMIQQIDEGVQNSDMILLVRGIEKLFTVLEAMKLVLYFPLTISRTT